MVDSVADALRIEAIGDIPAVRLSRAHIAFDAAVALVTRAIREAIASGHPHLLLDARAVAFGSPTLVDRLWMVRQWASAAEGRLRIAMLSPPDFIDPERFGVVAAGNFGLAAQVFVHEAEALAWLREERVAELRRMAVPLAAR